MLVKNEILCYVQQKNFFLILLVKLSKKWRNNQNQWKIRWEICNNTSNIKKGAGFIRYVNWKFDALAVESATVRKLAVLIRSSATSAEYELMMCLLFYKYRLIFKWELVEKSPASIGEYSSGFFRSYTASHFHYLFLILYFHFEFFLFLLL